MWWAATRSGGDTTPAYGPDLVRNFSHRERQHRKSTPRGTSKPMIVSQVGPASLSTHGPRTVVDALTSHVRKIHYNALISACVPVGAVKGGLCYRLMMFLGGWWWGRCGPRLVGR